MVNGSQQPVPTRGTVVGKWPIPLPKPNDSWKLESLKKGILPSTLRTHVDWRFKHGLRPEDPTSDEGSVKPFIETQCGHTCCSTSQCLVFPWMRCAQLATEWQRTSVLACMDYGMKNRNLVLNQWEYDEDGQPKVISGVKINDRSGTDDQKWRCGYSNDLMCAGENYEAPDTSICYNVPLCGKDEDCPTIPAPANVSCIPSPQCSEANPTCQDGAVCVNAVGKECTKGTTSWDCTTCAVAAVTVNPSASNVYSCTTDADCNKASDKPPYSKVCSNGLCSPKICKGWQRFTDLCPAKSFCADTANEEGKVGYLQDYKGDIPATTSFGISCSTDSDCGRKHGICSNGKCTPKVSWSGGVAPRPLQDIIDGRTMQGRGTFEGFSGQAVLMWLLDYLGPVQMNYRYSSYSYSISYEHGLYHTKLQCAKDHVKDTVLANTLYWDASIGNDLYGTDGGMVPYRTQQELKKWSKKIGKCEMPDKKSTKCQVGASGNSHCMVIVGYRYISDNPGLSYWIIANQHGADDGDSGYQYFTMNLGAHPCGMNGDCTGSQDCTAFIGYFHTLYQPDIHFSKDGLAARVLAKCKSDSDCTPDCCVGGVCKSCSMPCKSDSDCIPDCCSNGKCKPCTSSSSSSSSHVLIIVLVVLLALSILGGVYYFFRTSKRV